MRSLLLGLALLIAFVSPVSAQEQKIPFGRFGTVTVYSESAHPKHVVLFVSGDGGWNLGVVDMARALTSLDALVIGIDITHYLRELAKGTARCSYPPGDLEALSHYIQKKLGFTHYVPPVLVGYSSGATLVYTTLVQSPPGTFQGAISLGFCPDLPLHKPMCRGYGLESHFREKPKGYVFSPSQEMEAPWIILHGTIDQVCDLNVVKQFVSHVKNAELVVLPKVGHGFSVQRHWMPQFKEAFQRIVATPLPGNAPIPGDLQDLPLVEVPAQGTDDTLAVLVTGDGGWAGIDKELAAALSKEGIPVVGLNSLQYFWSPRTPDSAAKDLERILRHYLSTWEKHRILLVGYSFGADVLPFMVSRLPSDLQARIELLTLLGPSRDAHFEFHVSDWLGGGASKEEHPVLPEIRKLSANTAILCVYGQDDKNSVCTDLSKDPVSIKEVPGGHHFGGDYERLAHEILAHMK